ncbi:cyclic AMP-dependent transcription factor ATF-3-like [Saccoglossus kowalevskii]|uniref:Cyclic AMP-dependent transcription factor ATF-3-like n=1 Tax=Saccoglossus kowalevskii TaxID=10224 RepID=A0ABM0GSJ9_SACKO|nr:PREDICTED: cyclic AMP-dependent transcription factor ATF-3-like [Saccoglossus kowalevskii]
MSQTDQTTSTDFSDTNLFEALEISPDTMMHVDIMPLIKDGLKYTIQAKRRAQGLAELSVEQKRVRPEKLTPAEAERRRIRRERNRIAATKCRNKKRSQINTLDEESKRLEGLNHKLKEEIGKLQIEKSFLSDTLQAHLSICSLTQAPAIYDQ